MTMQQSAKHPIDHAVRGVWAAIGSPVSLEPSSFCVGGAGLEAPLPGPLWGALTCCPPQADHQGDFLQHARFGHCWVACLY